MISLTLAISLVVNVWLLVAYVRARRVVEDMPVPYWPTGKSS